MQSFLEAYRREGSESTLVFLEDFAEVKARREMLSIQENKYNEEIMQIKENYENLQTSVRVIIWILTLKIM